MLGDDFSNDGTWEWMNEIVKKDPNVKIHRNERSMKTWTHHII